MSWHPFAKPVKAKLTLERNEIKLYSSSLFTSSNKERLIYYGATTFSKTTLAAARMTLSMIIIEQVAGNKSSLLLKIIFKAHKDYNYIQR